MIFTSLSTLAAAVVGPVAGWTVSRDGAPGMYRAFRDLREFENGVQPLRGGYLRHSTSERWTMFPRWKADAKFTEVPTETPPSTVQTTGAAPTLRPPLPNQKHTSVVCPEPPAVDGRLVQYRTLTKLNSSYFAVATLHRDLWYGYRPNPEAVPICDRWFSSNSREFSTEDCVRRCNELAFKICTGIHQNWIYKSWKTDITKYPEQQRSALQNINGNSGGGDTVANGVIDCVLSYMFEDAKQCMGPCAFMNYYTDTLEEAEIPCAVPYTQCYSHLDPRTSTTSTVPPTQTRSTRSSITQTTSPRIHYNMLKGEGSLRLVLTGCSLLGIASIAAACCWCYSGAHNPF